MKTPLLPYFQVKSKLSCYAIAIVGGYLVIAGGGNAQAGTPSNEPQADPIDRDTIASNQVSDRAAIEQQAKPRGGGTALFFGVALPFCPSGVDWHGWS